MLVFRLARSTGLLLGFVLFLCNPVRADELRFVKDVTPDLGWMSGASESLAFDGRGALLVASGRPGFHRTGNGGETWRRAMDGFAGSDGVERFAFAFCQAPSAPATVYALSGATVPGQPIFRTDDLGRSWHEQGSIAALLPVDCAVDASNAEVVYLLARDESFAASLLRSADGGQTWKLVGGGLPALDSPTFVRVSRTGPGTVYVGDFGTFEGLYESADGGSSFTRLSGAPIYPFYLFAHPALDGVLFVISGGDGFLYRSGDSGATFTQVGPSVVANSLAFDPDDPAAVYLGVRTGPLLRSTDAGLTFAPLPGPASEQLGQVGVVSVGVAPARGQDAQVFVSTSRGPFRSDNGGRTFRPIHRGYHGAPVNDLRIDSTGRLMVGALNSVVVFRAPKAGQARAYDEFGVKLTLLPTDELPAADWEAAAVAPSPVNPDVAVVVTLANGVYSTLDGGATWTQSSIAPSFFNYFTRATFAPGSASRVYIVSSRGLHRSDDAGLSFQRMSVERFGAIALAPGNPDVAFLAAFDTGHGIFKTTDGGATITPVGVPGNFSTLAIDAGYPQVIYAGNRAGGVLRSLDGGATWPSASTGLPASEVLAVSADPRIAGRAYAWVKAAGLFATADGGETWTVADSGESARRSSIEVGRASMAVDPAKPGRIYLGNSGVLQIDTLATSDDEGDDD